jgi:hypothetical protein
VSDFEKEKNFGDTPIMGTIKKVLNDYDGLDPVLTKSARVFLIIVSDFDHNSNYEELFHDPKHKELARELAKKPNGEEAKKAMEKIFAARIKARNWNVLTVYAKKSKAHSNTRFMKELSTDEVEYNLFDTSVAEKINAAIKKGSEEAPIVFVLWIVDHSDSMNESVQPIGSLVKQTTKEITDTVTVPPELDLEKWTGLPSADREIGSKAGAGGRPDEIYHLFRETRGDLFISPPVSVRLWNLFLEATGQGIDKNPAPEAKPDDSQSNISYSEMEAFLSWVKKILSGKFEVFIADERSLEYAGKLHLPKYSHGTPNRLRMISSTWYGEYCQEEHVHTLDCEPQTGILKVVKDYSWLDDSPVQRPQFRGGIAPDERSAACGFRLVAVSKK